MQICQWKHASLDDSKHRQESVLDHNDKFRLQIGGEFVKETKPEPVRPDARSSVTAVALDWECIEQRYKEWHKSVYVDQRTKTPTAQQARILEAVHLQTKLEYFLEQGLPLSADIADLKIRPMYRLAHGLPGSGKSQVLLWIRDYFEQVWGYKHGDEFVFVAGQNSMADNIGGVTMHSFFALPFKDRRGVTINSAVADKNWNAKLTRMNVLKFIFIDEIEAAGADLLGKAEEETRRHTRRADMYRYHSMPDGKVSDLPRAWGGVNVMFIGDWWQLHPTGGIAVMSNPFATGVLECSYAQPTMASLWRLHSNSGVENAAEYGLQEWADSEWVLQLSTNIRSGEDEWWNAVLEQCRQGELTQNNYDWMHGFAASTSIVNSTLKFWYAYRKDKVIFAFGICVKILTETV